MDRLQFFCLIFAFCKFSQGADHEYMVTNAESVIVPLGFDTTFTCEMNIAPDKFQWKFYPLPSYEEYNPKANINLNSMNFSLIPTQNHTQKGNKCDLTVRVMSREFVGDYQCLAYYGALVVASVPWRITIGTLRSFPRQSNADITVTEGNTVNWRCESPQSNPEAYIDYYKDDSYFPVNFPNTSSLIILNVKAGNSGKYRCKATNPIGGNETSSSLLNLKVVPRGEYQKPRFIIEPKKVYTVVKGDNVLLECSAVGNPIPEVVWRKKVGAIPITRTEMMKAGLLLNNVTSSDDGIYECVQKNHLGQVHYQITLVYNEPPTIKKCSFNSTEVNQGENLELDCEVSGTPEPQITWFLNGFSVMNDSKIEAIGPKIYFSPIEKRHAGKLQIFATNAVKTTYFSIRLTVIPKSTSIDFSTTKSTKSHGHKQRRPDKLIYPPSKPTVSRISDESVVVRWTVPNKGLPVLFFKVQYRELGPANQHHHRGKGSKWLTTNTDIDPHCKIYLVNNLKPDHWYRFRIAAVYSNNDNKNSQNSDKFLLRRLDFDNRNPLPIPLITHTQPVNSSTIKIYWKTEHLSNITLEGYYINYIPANLATDYMWCRVDGENTSSYLLAHLNHDTVYDIKLQSFTTNLTSEFSGIMKARTMPLPSVGLPHSNSTQISHASENGGISKLYIIIAVGVLVGGGALVCAIVLLLYCKKWKEKKNMNREDGDKPAVEEHHIQADGSDYVVTPKFPSRVNGHQAGNHITIRANPLADADNKNQNNVMEMSCLSANNNCSEVQAAGADDQQATTTNSNNTTSKTSKSKKRNNHKRGENYV